MESTSLESEIFKVTETDFERIKNENRKIERFGDSTENIHNEKNALEQIIIDKSRVNSEKRAYSRIVPKTVFSGNLGLKNTMVMVVWRYDVPVT